MDNIKIYVITHKSFNDNFINSNDIYIPLLVGVDNGNRAKSKYLCDNVGKNISAKNKSFCELTGIYWVWQHSNAKIVGFDHYRRYFVNNNGDLLNESDIFKALKDADLILPKKEPDAFLGKTAAQYFGDHHDPLVWTICRDIINENYPNYIEDFDWYSRQTSGYSYNMVIGNSKLLNKYNAWLFNILFQLEKKIDLSIYTDYNQRMYGFVSERLINVWIHHNNLVVKEYPVIFTEKKSKIKSFARKVVGRYWQKTHCLYK